MESPKVFISYSWTTPEHEQRVLDIATELVESGIDTILDKCIEEQSLLLQKVGRMLLVLLGNICTHSLRISNLFNCIHVIIIQITMSIL